ncbi:hypothetical protein E2C01_092952 [Portunus trituberculatus]|uniref:Uncharacterized protein n=1 Tax=Portunus trituberculatus TaxID=210409 RepID=A0A5B7JWV9_PORTR|nr:hypothetical protein [Portunus trituberculatus]
MKQCVKEKWNALNIIKLLQHIICITLRKN